MTSSILESEHTVTSLSPSALVEQTERAFVASGYTVVRLSDPKRLPTRFLLSGPAASSLVVLAYVRNLTPADRSDPDEYRIQLSGNTHPLHFERYATTVLLGYHLPSKLFVGFDPRAVSPTARGTLTAGYVSLGVVKGAKSRGMTFDMDRRNRLAVGMQPELLVPYCLHANEIHEAADEMESLAILNGATAAFTQTRTRSMESSITAPPTPRQRLIRTVRVLSREAGFRRRVLEAYDHRCVISKVQLGLVDAAHILPVSEKGSIDSVANGLSLLPQYHRAFDSGLIYLTRRFVMKINDERVRQLRREDRLDGLDDLRQALGTIALPRNKRLWPDPALIVRANRARGIVT